MKSQTATNSLRRPSRSASLPKQSAPEEDRVGRDHPLEVRLGELRSVWIEGSATFTIATSRMTMNCAVTMRASALQRRSLFVRVLT